MRKRIFDIIERSGNGDRASSIYDVVMIAIILISLIPLAFKQQYSYFVIIERISTCIFIIDYFLRLYTADYKLNRGIPSFLLYPITPMALIDLLSILPSFIAAYPALRMLKLFRLFRSFRVFRVFKMLRYSKSISIISNVIHNQKSPLIAVGTLAIGYILISALVVFNVEPDTFESFFDAIYWATISLTTMGYGDIYPVSTAGRLVTMISSFVGIAIVALPAGIITAGYMSEIEKDNTREE